MKTFTFKKIAIMAFAAFTANFMNAQEATVLTPTADTWVWKGNTTVRGTDKFMEIHGTDFVGLMSFTLAKPSEHAVVKSASLRLVSSRIKSGDRGLSVYPFNADFTESYIYSDVETAVTEAFNSTAIASFDMNGQNDKDFTLDNLSADYRNVEAWTNTIDVTDYVKSLSTDKFSIMIASADTESNNQRKIFTKESSDGFTNTKDAENTFTVAGEDVIPQLTVTYDNTTGIDDVSVPVLPVKEIYTLQGVKISKMTASGIYIINGKKIVKE